MRLIVFVCTLAIALSATGQPPFSLDSSKPLNSIDSSGTRSLTGTYEGVVKNLTVGKSATFSIVVSEDRNGAIQGCMAVRLPLSGSGHFRGRAGKSQVSFLVEGDFSNITFTGSRDETGLNGTYTVSYPNSVSTQKGTFMLTKAASGTGSSREFDILHCPDDAVFMHQEAEKANPEAEAYLGMMYLMGSGVPKDDSKALLWFSKGADQGNSEAQVGLGAIYDAGSIVPRDVAKAASLFANSAEQGNPLAQGLLGVHYSLGAGLPRDLHKAYFWTYLAEKGMKAATQEDLPIVKRSFDEVSALLTPDECLQLRQQADDWLAVHPFRY